MTVARRRKCFIVQHPNVPMMADIAEIMYWRVALSHSLTQWFETGLCDAFTRDARRMVGRLFNDRHLPFPRSSRLFGRSSKPFANGFGGVEFREFSTPIPISARHKLLKQPLVESPLVFPMEEFHIAGGNAEAVDYA
jgi:hypothetical protein